MAWIAVDKTGQEVLTDGKPSRDRISRNKELSFWSYVISIEGEYGECVIDLPKGTIEKLIGRKLSWEDEPVELM